MLTLQQLLIVIADILMSLQRLPVPIRPAVARVGVRMRVQGLVTAATVQERPEGTAAAAGHNSMPDVAVLTQLLWQWDSLTGQVPQ